jgi:hypothetical protein
MESPPLAKAMVFPFMAVTCDMFWQGICRNTSVFWRFNANNIYNYLKFRSISFLISCGMKVVFLSLRASSVVIAISVFPV